MRIRQNKSGLILITTLWILLILTLFALGIARNINLDLLLNRYSIDKLKSYYAVKAAIAFAQAQLELDSKDFDTMFECGITLEEGKAAQEIFKDVLVGESSFNISYPMIDSENNPQIIYGFEDEERRINLNGINQSNFKVLISLLEILEVDSEAAQNIASSVVDWRDSNSDVTNQGYGAEDTYYTGLEPSYHCKNSNFQNIAELLLIKGVTKEIFERLKDYVTVFPQDANELKVNVNTAGEIVLQALANYAPGRNPSDADSLVQKIIDYRNGDDNIISTADDRLVELNKLDLNPAERTIFANLSSFFIVKSNYFRINAEGRYRDKKVKSKITAILERDYEYPVSWFED